MDGSGISGGIDELRLRYGHPTEGARKKTLNRLDPHCRRFIALSPFLCLGTSGPNGADVSPRGDPPGFVQVLDERTLLIPDRPGNKRLDSLTNLLENPKVGLLFMIPGVEDTLRVNGVARITDDPALLARLEVNGKAPESALLVEVREAFLHCGKALIRSRLWRNDYRVERTALPSQGKMIADQVAGGFTAEPLERRFTAEQADAVIATDAATRLY